MPLFDLFLSDPKWISYNSFTLTYDAENRNVSMVSATKGNETYAYDGDGRRVKKVWTPTGGTTTTTYYVYNALGQLAAEYSNQAPSNNGVSWMSIQEDYFE